MNDKPDRSERPIQRFAQETGQKFEVLAGFLGWYVVNTAVFFIFVYGASMPVILVLWPFINIGGLLILASFKRTRQVALGILIAMAFNLFISLVFGMFMNALCFLPFFLR